MNGLLALLVSVATLQFMQYQGAFLDRDLPVALKEGPGWGLPDRADIAVSAPVVEWIANFPSRSRPPLAALPAVMLNFVQRPGPSLAFGMDEVTLDRFKELLGGCRIVSVSGFQDPKARSGRSYQFGALPASQRRPRRPT